MRNYLLFGIIGFTIIATSGYGYEHSSRGGSGRRDVNPNENRDQNTQQDQPWEANYVNDNVPYVTPDTGPDTRLVNRPPRVTEGTEGSVSKSGEPELKYYTNQDGSIEVWNSSTNGYQRIRK